MVLAVPVVLEFTETVTGAEKLNEVPVGFSPDPRVRPFAEDRPRFARAVGISVRSARFKPLWSSVL